MGSILLNVVVLLPRYLFQNVHKGTWLDGLPNGFGNLKIASLSLRYIGHFKAGNRHGYGVFESILFSLSSVRETVEPGLSAVTEQFLSAIDEQPVDELIISTEQVTEILLRATEISIEDAILSSHIRFAGLWENGIPQGSCKLIFSNGEVRKLVNDKLSVLYPDMLML